MFIKEVKKKHSPKGNTFYQYNLVQAMRVEGKVKQRNVLYLGSDPLLRDTSKRKEVLSILKSKIFKHPSLFPEDATKEVLDLATRLHEKFLVKYGNHTEDMPSIPSPEHSTNYHRVDVDSIESRDVRSFGAENLCCQVMDKLQLRKIFNSLGFSKDQINKAKIAIASRAIFATSDYNTSQLLSTNSSLNECLGYEPIVSHKQLYAISDQLYKFKETIDKQLYKRISNMFNLEDRLVIFDLSNTYFETSKSGNSLTKFSGNSKEKRTDCPVVVFSGVINKEGFIRHSSIYEGNTPDAKTLEQMLGKLEKYSDSRKNKTVVIDAGIATEKNLEIIKAKGYDYVCVSRKRLKDYQIDHSKMVTKQTSRGKQKVELNIFSPEGYSDTWMYVQSEQKQKKETSMRDKLCQRFEQDLEYIQAGFTKKRGTKAVDKVWERIGRAKEKHKRVSAQYVLKLGEVDGKATMLTWERKPDPVKQDKERGVYFIRTSYQSTDESDLWDIYNTIREVEATFRCLKSDLNIRPVHHQNDSRIESHIYLTILAYQLVNTIRFMLKREGLNHSWRRIIQLMSTQVIQTLEVPTDTKRMYIRKTSHPIKEVSEIYRATNCKQIISQKKKYVVYH